MLSMNSYWCPDYSILMDAGYQSGARMNIGVNQVSNDSCYIDDILSTTAAYDYRYS